MAGVNENKALRDRRAEMINRHEVISHSLRCGYNAFTAVVDDGIDFILHRFDGQSDSFFKVQLKSRFTIHTKYRARDIWIAFPVGSDEKAREWYLAPHDMMAEFADDHNKSASWTSHGSYSAVKPGSAMQKILANFTLKTVLERSKAGIPHPWPLSHTGEGESV